MMVDVDVFIASLCNKGMLDKATIGAIKSALAEQSLEVSGNSVRAITSKELHIEAGKRYKCIETFLANGEIVVAISGQVYEAREDNVIVGYCGRVFTDGIDGDASKHFELFVRNTDCRTNRKFNIGEWVVFPNGDTDYVTSNTYAYSFTKHYMDHDECEKSCHSWTIVDAKSGDVLVDCDGNIGILGEVHTKNWNSLAYCSRDGSYVSPCGGMHAILHTLPADEQQCNALYRKMIESYHWADYVMLPLSMHMTCDEVESSRHMLPNEWKNK